MEKIAIIGAGNMGGAIALALSAATYPVTVANPSLAKLQALRSVAKGDLHITTDNAGAVRGADLIILAVKPYLIAQVLEQVLKATDRPHVTIASLAAGISLDDLRRLADAAGSPATEINLVRVMPNIAATVDESMTFVCGDSAADASGATTDVAALFDIIGECDVISESQFTAAMAVASCGIAFAMRYLRATVTAAVATGLRPADALRYSLHTMRGALALIEANPDTHIEELIDRVCTPGGVTIRGLEAMERAGFTPAVSAAIHAAAK